jgi:phage shock protein E
LSQTPVFTPTIFASKFKEMTLEAILKSPTKSIVDVRTVNEFAGGNVATSINIPLHELPEHVETFKTMDKPIVLCCASGMRSAQATQYLTSLGIEQCYNGGSWHTVNELV